MGVGYFLDYDLHLLADSEVSLLAGWKQVPRLPPGHLLLAPLHPSQQSIVLHVSVPMYDGAAVGDPVASEDFDLMRVLCDAEAEALPYCLCLEPLQAVFMRS